MNIISIKSIAFLTITIAIILQSLSCQSINTNGEVSSNIQNGKQIYKQKGAHYFGHVTPEKVKTFKQYNYDWMTLVPWSHQEDIYSNKIEYYNGDPLHLAKRDSSWKSRIEIAHDAGLKVFLKPHVWIQDTKSGKWRSDIYPTNEENWKTWSEYYREFILHYASIAEENKVEMFCVGTEFTRLTKEKTDYWTNLIIEVRKIYSGKITYAANWYQEYESITFWDQLDYIGIQAYFPLVQNENPTTQEISKGWKKYLEDIEKISQRFNKKVLFTEMGYKSSADSAVEPWKWFDYSEDANNKLSLETQVTCYEGFFDTVWNQDWFAGVHIWQLNALGVEYNGSNNADFTPVGKPAQKLITEKFK